MAKPTLADLQKQIDTLTADLATARNATELGRQFEKLSKDHAVMIEDLNTAQVENGRKDTKIAELEKNLQKFDQDENTARVI